MGDLIRSGGFAFHSSSHQEILLRPGLVNSTPTLALSPSQGERARRQIFDPMRPSAAAYRQARRLTGSPTNSRPSTSVSGSISPAAAARAKTMPGCLARIARFSTLKPLGSHLFLSS